MLELQHPYPAVAYGAAPSYGGNQMLSPDPLLRRGGCGVVGALDLLLYLGRYHPGCAVDFLTWDGEPIPPERYEAMLRSIRRACLPLLTPLGLNGVTLALGLNHLFRTRRLPLSARWVWRRGELWRGMEQMLREDIPVILAVGPNFPLLLSRKNRLPLCRRDAQGQFRPAASAVAHYVTVTARDGAWLRCASWGWEYFLRIESLEEYARLHSSYVFCNILKIEKRRR